MKLSACKFYSLLMSDVEELCQNQPRNQRPDNVDCFMLCLAFRLSKLDKEWAEYIPHRLVLIFFLFNCKWESYHCYVTRLTYQCLKTSKNDVNFFEIRVCKEESSFLLKGNCDDNEL